MKITGILASAVALALLGTGTANAAVVFPGTATGSSLIVTVFDAVTLESVTTDLGVLYNSFINNSPGPNTIAAGAYTERSFTLDMTAFNDNNVANLRYNVYAGDSLGLVGRQGVIITSTSAAPTMTNSQLGPGVNVQGTQLLSAMGLANPFTSDYGDEAKWGDFINGQFPSGSAAAPGTPLSFFAFATTSGIENLATVTQFSNALGDWKWNLEGNELTFSAAVAPVPLPAAAWLLLSGIAGLGAFSRRRATQA